MIESDKSQVQKGIDTKLKTGIIFLVISIVFILLLPFLLTRPNFIGFDFTSTGQIGDTIGGIVGPFVAIIAAVLTFLAFWMQYQANIIQIDNFRKQQDQAAIDKFENRVSEFLALHRQNVAELEIRGAKGNVAKGREIFPVLFSELKRTYQFLENFFVLNENYSDLNNKEVCTQIAYLIFFVGITQYEKEYFTSTLGNLIESKESVDKLIKYFVEARDQDELIEDTMNSKDFENYVIYPHFKGHIPKLGHYYRHLFQMVKYIVHYDSKIISDEKKYQYLRTIRAQLSSHEQLLLYYNSLSKFGSAWINNGYLTKYKMIKNIPLPLADFGLTPEEKFADYITVLKAKGDTLFEWKE